jgi:4'-phosphopantetheinyl transferase EntD
VTGRACARIALRRLGVPPTAIASGKQGEPVWPAGVVGSITHCRGYRACVVALQRDVRAVGIDAEVHQPLPRGVFRHVAGAREQLGVMVDDAGVCLDRLIFSAKESVFKAWFPMTTSRLDFEDIALSVDVCDHTFSARLLPRRLRQRHGGPATMHGRWAVDRGLVTTAVVVLD